MTTATYTAPVATAPVDDSPAPTPREPFYLELADVKLFRQSLERVCKAISRRSYVAILQGVELVISGEHGNYLELTATDLSVVIRERLELGATVSAGSAIVDGRALLAACKGLEGSATLELTGDELAMLELRQGSSSISLPAFPLDDYPVMRGEGFEGSGFELTVDRGEFVRAVTAIGKTFSRDDSRPVLTGVYCALEGNRLVLVATDSYRLAVDGIDSSREDRNGEPWPAMIVPGEYLVKAAAMAGKVKTGEPLTFELVTKGTARMIIRDGARTVTMRAIDGQYPDWRKLVPADMPTRVTFDAAGALVILERLDKLVGKSSPVRLTVPMPGYGPLTFEGETADMATVRDELECAAINDNGEPLVIGFNPAFLADAIRTIGDERVTLWLINALRPGLVTGEGFATHNGLERFVLVMPIRLKG